MYLGESEPNLVYRASFRSTKLQREILSKKKTTTTKKKRNIVVENQALYLRVLNQHLNF